MRASRLAASGSLGTGARQCGITAPKPCRVSLNKDPFPLRSRCDPRDPSHLQTAGRRAWRKAVAANEVWKTIFWHVGLKRCAAVMIWIGVMVCLQATLHSMLTLTATVYCLLSYPQHRGWKSNLISTWLLFSSEMTKRDKKCYYCCYVIHICRKSFHHIFLLSVQ